MTVFAVLLVCSGNQCRSPAAAVVLQGYLASLRQDGDRCGVGDLEELAFETASAGTALPSWTGMDGGSVAASIHPLTAQALSEAGFAIPPHKAQRLSPDLVGAADLILTAERRHRAAVVEADLGGAAARRTFTMLEFARVASGLAVPSGMTPPSGLLGGATSPSEVVAQVAAARVAAPATAEDDLPDPVGLGLPAHRQMVELVARAMRDVAHSLAG